MGKCYCVYMLYKFKTYFNSFKLSFLGAKLPPPCSFCLRIRLHTAFELVNLLPAIIELLLHIRQFLGKPAFGILASPIKVQLDLTQCFQTCDQVIVENAEIGKRLRLRLAPFLLTNIRKRTILEERNAQKIRAGVLSTPKILSMY